MNDNNIVLTAYDVLTLVSNSELERAEGITWTTGYPGGRYLDMSFFLPRDIATSWAVALNNRIVAQNGLTMVWEGYVSSIVTVSEENRSGINVTCIGAWANYLEAQHIRKPWADTRIDEDIWRVPTTANNANDKTLLQICEVDRENRIRFTPRSTRDAATPPNETGWTNGWYYRVVYTAPTGQTVKRITFNFDLQEITQQWTIALYNVTTAAAVWSRNTTGTGAVDHTLATPSQSIWLYFEANANQTPPTDGTVYGEFSAITVYTETGAIDLQQIAIDIAGYVSGISAGSICATTLSLVPFVAEGESYAELLLKAASYGDGSTFTPFAVYVTSSEDAGMSFPALVVESVPSLYLYDYAIQLGESNVAAPFQAEQDISEIRNWIAVNYTTVDGRSVWTTPDDDATLKDAVSIATYGQREEWLTIDTTSSAVATAYAKAFLSQRKDPQWTVSGGITVCGYVYGLNGEKVPVSEIKPGKTIKIMNFLYALSGTGLTLLITGTSYSDQDETNQLTIGRSSRLDVQLARWMFNLSRGRGIDG